MLIPERQQLHRYFATVVAQLSFFEMSSTWNFFFDANLKSVSLVTVFLAQISSLRLFLLNCSFPTDISSNQPSNGVR